NEDALIEMPEIGIWLVADGMGGHQKGDFASQTVVDVVSDIQPSKQMSRLIAQLCDRLRLANRLLREESTRRACNVIGTTVAALVLSGRHAVCVWVGDSRVYRLRGGRLQQLTRDHSWVEEYVSMGLMTRDMADHHPLSHEITRAIGAEDDLELSIAVRELAATDRFLLCSDGLHGEISDQEIAQLLGGQELDQTCREMVNQVKKRGAHDNVSLIVVQVINAA
ncbi:MAG: protein phosphatase 2C domain-containing protein, partial [Chromatiales bacterium]